MTAFDYTALAIIGLSMVLSVLRGLTQEVLALAAWALAFWLSSTYAGQMARFMPSSLPTEGFRFLASFLVIFFLTWLLSAILRATLNQFLQVTGLKPFDRLLGAGFGMMRGFLLMLMLVILAGMTSFPQEPVWRNAMFSPLFEQSARMVLPWLPSVLASRVKFE